jgi:thioredoxin reductase (NADPH)
MGGHKMTKQYDVIVIGAGPAGMTAALYASRANLKTALLDRGICGGQMNNTDKIENYPGFSSVQGPDLAKQMYDSTTRFGTDYVYGDVTALTVDEQGIKHVDTDGDEELTAPAVIIATGSEPRKLGVTGEEEYGGRGVSYCAVCDGPFFKDEDVTVIGGGNSAIEEGLYLANLAKNVNVVHRRDSLRAEKILQDQAFKNDKMGFTWNSQVEAIEGDGEQVTAVKVKNKETGQEQELPTKGVFIYVGAVPMSQPFAELGLTDEHGWIATDDAMQTKIPGIFAAGDIRGKRLRQITTAVGDGGIAGQEAFNYIERLQASK